jgi:hypothetical protein
MHEPWAGDIRDWGRRVWDEVPDVFGGIIRFHARDCLDKLPATAELYPEKFVADGADIESSRV